MKSILSKLYHFPLIFVILIFLIKPALSQQYYTLYPMQGIPQSSYSNPGQQPLADFYLGFPALSSIYFGLSNSGFALSDMLKKNPDGSLYIDDEGLLSALRKKNFIQAQYQHEWIGFGFRINRNYFSFNLTEKTDARLGYPRDLMKLAVRGNDYFLQQNIPATLSGLSADAVHYREFGFGYSRNWTDNLTAGLRVKALFGMSNINFSRSDFSLTTHPQTYALQLRSNLLVNTSMPIALSPLDSLGKQDDNDWEALAYLGNTSNKGLGIDLGATYQLNEYFSFGASIIDLGFIRWKSNTENFAMNGEFEFSGIDFNEFFSSENNDSFDQVMDSIRNVFDILETTQAYRTALPTRIYASASYHPTPYHTFSLLGRGEFFAGTFQPSLTTAYNFQPVPRFGSSLSYSFIHWSYHSVGLGFHVNLGPLQLYTVVDNFWPALRPHTFQTTSFHLGLNIVTGTRKNKPSEPSLRWN